MRLEPLVAPLDTVSCSSDSHGIVKRAIKEEDQPEEGNFRIPTCASIRVRGRKVMARERLHRAPCPLVRKVTRGGTDLSFSPSFLLLLLLLFHSLTSPIIYPSPRSLSLPLSLPFSLPPSTPPPPPTDPELPQQFRATQGHVR